ncbi:hypothetical protein HNP40_003503 [Mycobacteroides chelonae]|nr:hypothetical protein [Mycobacteroides chelonae]
MAITVASKVANASRELDASAKWGTELMVSWCHANASFPLADVNGGEPVPEFESYCSAVDYRSQ